MKLRIDQETVEQELPLLRQFLRGYLHQGRRISPEDAIDQAIIDLPSEWLRGVLDQLQILLCRIDDDVELRRVLNRHLGVDLYFRKPSDALEFASSLKRKLAGVVERKQS